MERVAAMINIVARASKPDRRRYGESKLNMLGRSKADLIRNYRNLPLLKSPAGYVFVLEDVDYGKRFIIGRCTHPVVQIDRIMAEYPFRTRIVFLERSDDAHTLEQELHRHYAGNLESGQWFDLAQTEIPEFEPADLGQPATLADLALNRVEGESLSQDERSATRIAPPDRRHQPIARARRSPRRLAAVCAFAIAIVFMFVYYNLDLQAIMVGSQPSIAFRPGSGPDSIPAENTTRPAEPNTEVLANDEPLPSDITGAIYVVVERARVRGCPRLSCDAAVTLRQGARIQSLVQITGQTVNGSNKWVAFNRNGSAAYVHIGEVSLIRAVSAEPETAAEEKATPSSESSRRPASIGDANGIEYKTDSYAFVWSCPRLDCEAVSVLEPDTHFRSIAQTKGQYLYGNNSWIAINEDGATGYVHISAVSVVMLDTAPGRDAETDSVQKPIKGDANDEQSTRGNDGTGQYTVTAHASLWECPYLDCRILEILSPGRLLNASGGVSGQKIGDNNVWISIDQGSSVGYVHSSLVAKVEQEEAVTAGTGEALAEPSPSLTSETRQSSSGGKAGLVYNADVTAIVRSCPRLNCRVAGYVRAGKQVRSYGQVKGQPIDDDYRWIVYNQDGNSGYVHRGELSTIDSVNATSAVAATAVQLELTVQPSSSEDTSSGAAQVSKTYRVSFRGTSYAIARSCPSRSCEISGRLSTDDKIKALGTVTGEGINGNYKRVLFRHEGAIAYMHSGLLSASG